MHRRGASAGPRTQWPETSQLCRESTDGGGSTRWGLPTARLLGAGSRVCKTSLHAVLNGTHVSQGAKAGVLRVAKGSRSQGDGAASQCVSREGRGPLSVAVHLCIWAGLQLLLSVSRSSAAQKAVPRPWSRVVGTPGRARRVWGRPSCHLELASLLCSKSWLPRACYLVFRLCRGCGQEISHAAPGRL